MDRYRQFIDDVRRSRPQMPHPEEVSARIAERTGNMPQNTPAGPAPLRSRRIRFAAAVTGIAAAAVLVLTLSTVLMQTDTAVRIEIFPSARQPLCTDRRHISNIIVKPRPTDSSLPN